MAEQRIELTDVRPQEGATKKSRRKGRGISSGAGKTSGRGHRGEGQRSGNSAKRGFEGGQMPAFRRFPKLKGFEVFGRIKYAEVNVCDLEKYGFEEVSLETLIEADIVPNWVEAIRVLGNGEIKKAVKVTASYFTPSAKEKIEAAGGTAEIG